MWVIDTAPYYPLKPTSHKNSPLDGKAFDQEKKTLDAKTVFQAIITINVMMKIELNIKFGL